jgi:Amt family ammonium transporter
VEDTGVGIPQENLQQIFDPFFTTGTGNTSTGLGLSITHRIIEQHGGKLNVESAPGKGATFFIRIPIASTSKIDG